MNYFSYIRRVNSILDMAEKSKGIWNNWIVKNLLMAIALLLVLFLIVKFGLDIVTRHNRTVEVPDLTNMSVEEARSLARESHVGIKVTDSVFIYRLGSGVVYRQNPTAGAVVKRGRNIFLTINSVEPKKVAMPNLVGYSILEAKAELDNRGLVLGNLVYTPDIATNRVLQQKCRGRVVRPGEDIVSGSTIDLTIGLGRSESTTRVPYVVGQKYVAAVDALHDKYLNAGKLIFDPGVHTYLDSINSIVYKQDPGIATRKLGTAVTLYLTLDPEKVPKR